MDDQTSLLGRIDVIFCRRKQSPFVWYKKTLRLCYWHVLQGAVVHVYQICLWKGDILMIKAYPRSLLGFPVVERTWCNTPPCVDRILMPILLNYGIVKLELVTLVQKYLIEAFKPYIYKSRRWTLVAVTHTFCPSFPVGNWLGLGSAWVSGQVIFTGYTANNYPGSTFDLVVFGGKFNASWTSQTAKRMISLQSFFCFLYGNIRLI